MLSRFFFFNDTATTEIYTLSLHDALPISSRVSSLERRRHSCCTSISPSSATNTSLPSASTACAPTVARWPSNASAESCANRRIVSCSPESARRACSLLGRTEASSRALGGTRYSARNIRMDEIVSWTSGNCWSAAGSTSPARGSGHAATTSSSSGRRPGSFCHSSSVMNGTTGCNSRSTVSKQYESTAPVSADNRGLTASTYQSASSFHTKSKQRFAPSSSRNCSGTSARSEGRLEIVRIEDHVGAE